MMSETICHDQNTLSMPGGITVLNKDEKVGTQFRDDGILISPNPCFVVKTKLKDEISGNVSKKVFCLLLRYLRKFILL